VLQVKVLVAYASHFGSTRDMARRIGEVLGRFPIEVVVAPVDAAPHPYEFDAFVIGSAIQGNHWLPSASDFVRREATLLSQRAVWLYSSGPVGDVAVASLSHNGSVQPAEVKEFRRLVRPRDSRVFAGSMDRQSADLSGLGFIERTVVMRFLPDGDWRDWAAIERWAQSIGSSLAEPAAGPRCLRDSVRHRTISNC
jgi:menaquinone-dependent protoporphyrinogen oxidase